MHATMLLLALAGKPPQAPTPPQAPVNVWVVSTPSGCPCGSSCPLGGGCGANCPCPASRGPSAAEKARRAKDGWQWCEDEGGYWWRWKQKPAPALQLYAPPVQVLPAVPQVVAPLQQVTPLFTAGPASFAPMPSFGGGGFRGGFSGGGACRGGG